MEGSQEVKKSSQVGMNKVKEVSAILSPTCQQERLTYK